MLFMIRSGDVVRAICNGAPRELVVEDVSSDGSVAQCSWTVDGVKHYVTVLVRDAQKIRSAVPPREQPRERR